MFDLEIDEGKGVFLLNVFEHCIIEYINQILSHCYVQ